MAMNVKEVCVDFTCSIPFALRMDINADEEDGEELV